MIEEEFPVRLRVFREAKGYTRAECAMEADVSVASICAMENGKAFPKMKVFFSLCDCFGITPEEFFAEGLTCTTKNICLFRKMRELSEKDLLAIEGIVDRLLHKQ